MIKETRFSLFIVLLAIFALSMLVSCSSMSIGSEEEKKESKTEDVWKEATQKNPENPWQYVEEKDAAMKAKTWEQKIGEYTKKIAEYPGISWYYAARGNAHRELKHYADAIADYSKAIEIDGEMAWYYAARADAKYRSGQKDAAIADYDLAIRLAPEERRFQDAKAEIETAE